MTTTVVSIILIQFGKGFIVLENTPMVFLGEISYSWYLLHWPMLSLQKIFEYTTALGKVLLFLNTIYSDMVLGIILSFIVAVIVHYSLEKSYLDWAKPAIAAIVAILFPGCLALHYGLGSRFLSKSYWYL